MHHQSLSWGWNFYWLAVFLVIGRCLCGLATNMVDYDSSWWWRCKRVLAVWAHTDAGRWHTFCLNHLAKTFSLRHHPPYIYSFLKPNGMASLFIFSPAQTLTHIYIYRDGVLLKNYRPIVSLWISVVHLTLHQSHWNYHFIFFWDSLSVQRFFTLFHFLFSALATINGIDGVSRISPIEWQSNLD